MADRRWIVWPEFDEGEGYPTEGGVRVVIEAATEEEAVAEYKRVHGEPVGWGDSIEARPAERAFSYDDLRTIQAALAETGKGFGLLPAAVADVLEAGQVLGATAFVCAPRAGDGRAA